MTAPAGPARPASITVRWYVPVPDQATFTAADLAARLAELGEDAAAATAAMIARGEALNLGRHGAVYGGEGGVGTDLPGPLADLAAACQRRAAALGINGARFDGALDPEGLTIAVTISRDPSAEPAARVRPVRHSPAPDPGEQDSETAYGPVQRVPAATRSSPWDPCAEFAAFRRARDLARAFIRAGYRAAPGDRYGVELNPDDAARLLTALAAGPDAAAPAGQPEPGR